MPNVTLPDSTGPAVARALQLSEIGPAAKTFMRTVQRNRSMPRRASEAARMRIAYINGCALCIEARREEGLTDEFYDHVADWCTWPGYTDEERLAIEFAEAFALDHESIDDAMWARLHAAFDDEQLVSFGLALGQWLGLGRFTHVFHLDIDCGLGAPPPLAAAAE